MTSATKFRSDITDQGQGAGANSPAPYLQEQENGIPPRLRDISTKKALQKHFSEMLHSAELGTALDNTQAIELLWLLNQHPEAAEKIGVGVAGFFVKINPPYNSRGFGIIRVDSSFTDFSYTLHVSHRQL